MNTYLKSLNITNTLIVGLTYEFCAGSTAIDSAKNGYNTFIIKNACKAISEDNVNKIEEDFKATGVKIINSDELSNIFKA